MINETTKLQPILTDRVFSEHGDDFCTLELTIVLGYGPGVEPKTMRAIRLEFIDDVARYIENWKAKVTEAESDPGFYKSWVRALSKYQEDKS